MAESKKEKLFNNALVNYFQSSVAELRKVTWPTKNRAIRLTFLVLGFCVVTAIILGILDYSFSEGHKALLEISPAQTTQVPQITPEMINVTDSEGNPVEIEIGGETETAPADTVNETPVSSDAQG
jgi:preprotein translocase subunit SecE